MFSWFFLSDGVARFWVSVRLNAFEDAVEKNRYTEYGREADHDGCADNLEQ